MPHGLFRPTWKIRHTAGRVTGERPELVTGAVLGDQALTVHRPELAPEPADVDVNGAAVTPDVPSVRTVWPDVRHEVGATEYRSRVRAEEGQQLELLEGQRDLAVAGPDPAPHVVDALRSSYECPNQPKYTDLTGNVRWLLRWIRAPRSIGGNGMHPIHRRAFINRDKRNIPPDGGRSRDARLAMMLRRLQLLAGDSRR